LSDWLESAFALGEASRAKSKATVAYR
jgi:hypothetical protein